MVETDIKQEFTAKFDSFTRFLDSSGDLYNSYANKWNPTEYSSYAHSGHLNSAYEMGAMSWESAADHLFCFLRAAKEPVNPIGIFTCVRGAMESAALAAWLLDPNINPEARVSRHFAFRYEGLVQQLKYANEAGDRSIATAIIARIDKVEADAIAIGFSEVTDRKQRRAGIGELWPSITDLSEISLGMRKRYRLLSAVAHGHHWALINIGFKQIREEGSQIIAAKHAPPLVLLTLLGYSFECFARVLVNGHTLFGYDLNALHRLLNDYCDESLYKGNRFWDTP